MKLLRTLPAGLAIVALSTCGDSPPTQQNDGPGWLDVVLTTQESDAGGVLFTIRGGDVDSVRSSFPDVFDKRVGPLTKVVVAGNLTAGVIAEIFVPDVGTAASYSATVDQAAARTLEQRDPADYDVTIERQ